MSEKAQRIFFGSIMIGTLAYFFIQEYRRGEEAWILILVCFSCVLVMGFWLWLFKRLGWFKNTPYPPYRWTEKDRNRLRESYRKKTGREETLVACEFDDNGFQLIPEGGGSMSYPWTSIGRVVESPKGLYVYFRRWVYHWFPRAAFASGEDYRIVLGIISEHVPKFERFDISDFVFIALGSNLGESREVIRRAMERLQGLSSEPLVKSSLWETTPVDCPAGSPMFVNAVAGLRPRSGETPESLIRKLQLMEKEFGRQPKKVLNEARPLDLDLITFGKETRGTESLVLPHPRAHERRFVLQPLSEIAADLVLPGQTRTVAQLLAELQPDAAMQKI